MTEIAPGEPGVQAPVPAAAPPQAGEPPTATPSPDKLRLPPTPPQSSQDPAFLLRQYQTAQGQLSRTQQQMAQVRERLGLDRRAGPEDIIAALDALRQPPEPPADDEFNADIAVDPRVWEAEAVAEQARWQYQTAVYPGTAEAARDFTELVRSTSDPNVIVPAFYEILQRFAVQAAVEAEGEGEGQEPPQSAQPSPESRLDFTAGPARGPSAPKPKADLADLSGTGRLEEAVNRILGGAFGRPQPK